MAFTILLNDDNQIHMVNFNEIYDAENIIKCEVQSHHVQNQKKKATDMCLD